MLYILLYHSKNNLSLSQHSNIITMEFFSNFNLYFIHFLSYYFCWFFFSNTIVLSELLNKIYWAVEFLELYIEENSLILFIKKHIFVYI